MKKRFIYSNNGVLTDYTEEVNNYHSDETTIASFVAAEDAFYIGSTLPFNHIYLKMGTTVNAETAAMTVKLWDGTEFQDIAELMDLTEDSGVSLATSNFIEITPDKQESWSWDDTVDANGDEEITGLGNVTIYDKYWMKITFDADLTADLAISWIGQIFSTDDDLGSEFPDLVRSTVITAVRGAGATNWEPQHVRVAKIMIKDLKRKKVILDKNQILVREDLMLPAIQKLAEMIYGMMGDDYNDDRLKAQKEYIYRLSTAFPVIDKNSNARVDQREAVPRNGQMRR